MLETLDYTIRIGSTPTFLYLYFDKSWSINVNGECKTMESCANVKSVCQSDTPNILIKGVS